MQVASGPGSDFFEPYSHLELDLSMSLDLAVEFACWSLEAEHGDLGLDTDNDDKPPHSALGRTLVHRGGARAIQSLVNSIANDAFNNLTFIKLRLDAIRTATSVDAVLSVGDRLPGNRVAMFDAAIGRIAAQAQPQSRLGLAAISAAANRYHGRPFGELERELHRVVPRSGGAQGPRGRYSVAEVLKATAGFLTVDNTEDQVVAPYHESFFLYVTEGYNELLVWTRGDLRESVLESTQRWAYHRKTLQDLRAATLADEPCTFCRALYADVSAAAEDLFDESPLYRWSITKPAAIRESQDPVVITFRPCRRLRIETPGDNGAREEYPPEREFYMFPDNGE
ncbi:hypothetical protein SLS58_004073 [Diplodia intermedia]|uniref:Uncharacterized protein n=1 Tax=Diplodia intermedia TaxID=856260 RepID=A0ABR3TUM0_9PEZI